MTILLVGINAKFPQTNPAIRYLKKVLDKSNEGIEGTTPIKDTVLIQEFTINQSKTSVLRAIYMKKPDVLAFSVYIWNVDFVLALASDLKKILPKTIILTGGPEVVTSADIDSTIIGEGEPMIEKVLSDIREGRLEPIYNTGALADINRIPIAYEDFSQLENQVIYYESSRGCPFHCQYCVSGAEGDSGTFRQRSLSDTLSHLQLFLNARLKRVKLIDRTFNASKRFAYQVWKFLIENHNGTTNFHFEVVADLLDEHLLSLLETAPTGLFQFEIGIQSMNDKTLLEVTRRVQPEILTGNILRLLRGKNIFIHLDLIAGLPYETLDSFISGFNTVMKLRPHKLQLGFLKILKGTAMEKNAESLGIVYTKAPPYEILHTPWLSYEELCLLKSVEKVLDLYYNSHRFIKSLAFLLRFFNTPFDFFHALSVYFQDKGLNELNHSNEGYYRILYDFAASSLSCLSCSQYNDLLCSYLRFDLCSHEPVKKIPAFLQPESQSKLNEQYKNKMRELQKSMKTKSENTFYLEIFPFAITKELDDQLDIASSTSASTNLAFHPCIVQFDYNQRDVLGNAKACLLSSELSECF